MRHSGIGLAVAGAMLYAGVAGAQDAPADEPVAGEPIVDPMPQARGVKWYDGLSITPGVSSSSFAEYGMTFGEAGSMSRFSAAVHSSLFRNMPAG